MSKLGGFLVDNVWRKFMGIFVLVLDFRYCIGGYVFGIFYIIFYLYLGNTVLYVDIIYDRFFNTIIEIWILFEVLGERYSVDRDVVVFISGYIGGVVEDIVYIFK